MSTSSEDVVKQTQHKLTVGLSEWVSRDPVSLLSSNYSIIECYKNSYLYHFSFGDISSIQKCGAQ